jgi:hypothetical protein
MIAHLADSWTPRTILREPEPEVQEEVSIGELTTLLLNALLPFPEARVAVSDMFARLRARPERSP